MELISREEVLSILSDVCNYALKVYDKEYHSPVRLAITTAIADIEILPKIESTPKSEWKQICWKPVIFREVEALHHYKCDNCYVEVRVDHIERYKYCPYCGAYMKVKENENNR